MLANLDGKPLGDPRPLRFKAGHRKQAWVRNVVALGLSGGFLEPLESTSIHLIQTGIARLLTWFPTRAFDPVGIAGYNALTEREYIDIRDFLVLHYNATERSDSEFWNYCRTMDVPASLSERIAIFQNTGRVIREHEELFTETSWLAVMVGQGIEAATYHPVADMLPDAEALDRLKHVREVVANTAAAMPGLRGYLARFTGATAERLRAAG